MATFIYGPQSNEVGVNSDATTWSAARAGTQTKNTTNSLVRRSQLNTWLGDRYYTGQLMLQYATNTLGSAARVMRAYMWSNASPVPANSLMTLRVGTFSLPVVAGDFVAGASLTGLTHVSDASAQSYFDIPAAMVNKTAVTKYLMHDSRQVTLSATSPALPTTSDMMGSWNFGAQSLYVVTSEPDSIIGLEGAAAQLADGSVVYLQSSGAATPVVTLRHVTTAGVVTTIDTVPTNGGTSGDFKYTGHSLNELAICVTGSDAIFVVGARDLSTSRVGKRIYSRTGPTSWTLSSAMASFTTNVDELPSSFAAVWCDSSAGSGTGRILVVWQSAGSGRGWCVYDAAIQGAHTGLFTSSSPAWLLPRLAYNDRHGISLDTDIFGGTRVLVGVTGDNDTAARFRLTRVTIGSSGLSSPTTVGEYSLSFGDAMTRTRVVGRGAANQWIASYTGSTWAGWLVNNLRVDNTTITVLPTVTGGTKFFDGVYSANNDEYSAYFWNPDNATMQRRGIIVSTGALQSTVTIALFTGVGERTAIRLPGKLRDSNHVETHHNRTSGTTVTFVRHKGEVNVAPLAPTTTAFDSFNATAIKRFEWVFNDPNVGDNQSAFQLRIINKTTQAVVHDTGKVLSANRFRDVNANTLTNGIEYEWEVRTWDLNDLVGPYAARRTFWTLTPPVVGITSPADSADISVSTFNVTWSYSQGQSLAQQQYRVRVIRQSDSQVVFDSGVVNSAASTHEVNGILSGVYTVEVRAWSRGTQSNISTRTINVSVDIKEETQDTNWVRYDPSVGVGDTGAFVFTKGGTYPTIYSLIPFNEEWDRFPTQPNYFDARRVEDIAAGTSFILTVDAKYLIQAGSATTFPSGLFMITVEYKDGTTEQSAPIQLKGSTGPVVGNGYQRFIASLTAKRPANAVRVTANVDLGDWGTVTSGELFMSALKFSSTGKIVSTEYVQSSGSRGVLVSGSGYVQGSTVSLYPHSLSDPTTLNVTAEGGAMTVRSSSQNRSKIVVDSQEFASVEILGDINNTTGEPGGASLVLGVDGPGNAQEGLTRGVVSAVNLAGTDGAEGTTPGTIGNSLLVGTKTAGPTHIMAANSIGLTLSSSELDLVRRAQVRGATVYGMDDYQAQGGANLSITTGTTLLSVSVPDLQVGDLIVATGVVDMQGAAGSTFVIVQCQGSGTATHPPNYMLGPEGIRLTSTQQWFLRPGVEIGTGTRTVSLWGWTEGTGSATIRRTHSVLNVLVYRRGT